MSELHQLSALTKLRAHYPSNDWHAFEDSLGGLAAVTRLRSLQISMSDRNEDTDMISSEPLTRLIALTLLQFSNVPAAAKAWQAANPWVTTFRDDELELCISAQVGSRSAHG